jgi:ankyrin repeat protein
MVKLLLECPNIDINLQDTNGNSALMFACNKESNIDMVKLLLEYPNIDVNLQSKNGLSALMIASNKESNSNVVKLLLEYSKNHKTLIEY